MQILYVHGKGEPLRKASTTSRCFADEVIWLIANSIGVFSKSVSYLCIVRDGFCFAWYWGGKSVTGGIKIEKTGCFDLEKAELVSNDSVHGNCFGQLRPVCLCIRGGKPRRPDQAGR